jgi:hypothetical protein
MAPAMRPATKAPPDESTPSTAKSAMYPPIGKPMRIAIGQTHNRRAVLVTDSVWGSILVPPFVSDDLLFDLMLSLLS